MNKTTFEFRGSGLSLLWLFIWTCFLTAITLGLFFPWAATYFMKWAAENTYIGGRQLIFKGSGLGFFGTWLLIYVLSIITFGIYIPWGMCRFYRWVAGNLKFADEQGLAPTPQDNIPQGDPRFAR